MQIEALNKRTHKYTQINKFTKDEVEIFNKSPKKALIIYAYVYMNNTCYI